MKLSKTQLEALKKLKEINFAFMPYGFTRAYYLVLDGSMKTFRVATVDKLIDLGLGKKIQRSDLFTDYEVTITEKGIKFLEGI